MGRLKMPLEDEDNIEEILEKYNPNIHRDLKMMNYLIGLKRLVFGLIELKKYLPIEDEYTEKQWKDIQRIHRVSGDSICKICKQPNRKHPIYKDLKDYQGNTNLREGCEDDLLKL